MTPSRDSDADTQHAAAASSGAPETEPMTERERALAALFGTSIEEPSSISDAEDSSSQEQLAALFSPPAPPVAETAQDLAEEWPEGIAEPQTAPAVGDAAPGVLAGSVASDSFVSSSAVSDADAAGQDAHPLRGAWRVRRSQAAPPGAESAETPPVAAADAPEPALENTEGALPDAAPHPERDERSAWLIAATAPAVAATAGVVSRSGVPDTAAKETTASDTTESDSASAGTTAPAPTSSDIPAPEADDDPLAWLGFTTEPTDEEGSTAVATGATASPLPDDQPARGTPPDWAAIVTGTAATTVVPAGAGAAAAVAPADASPPTAAARAPAGSFSPTTKRGIRGWSKKVRWSVAVSVVLLIAVVAGSVLIAQTLAADSRAAQELAASVTELEAAETAATEPEFALQEAIGIYDDTVALAQSTADSAGPALAAVVGMTDGALLAASDAALADLVAQLAVDTVIEPPGPYEPGTIDLTDSAAIAAATEAADAHAAEVTAATDAVREAQVALQARLDALRAAQVALGASLPATAEVIAVENPRAEQSFRDAVIAAAAAVSAAQIAGGSGDPEFTAYAAAVTALREDQARAEAVQPVRPANPQPQPQPTTDPAPAPGPAPVPDPSPAPEPDPTPVPDPSITP